MTPSPETDLYRSFPPLSIPLGAGKYLLASEELRSGVVIEEMEVEALACCNRFRTLQDHAQELVRQGNLESQVFAPILYQLAQLARRKLLVSRNSLIELIRSRSAVEAAPPSISTLGIVTRNRPEALRRCLESYLVNFRDYGRSLRCVVADDSDPPAAEANRAALAELRLRFGAAILYIGAEEKQRTVQALAAEGASLEDARFALSDPEECGFTAGANRNALLLETLGEMLVMVDDDTVCRMAAPPGERAGLALSSDTDPTEFWFHRDRASLLAEVPFQARDFAAGHEALLGKGVASCASAAEEVDFQQMDSRLLRRLEAGDARVRVTLSGIVGDSGMGGNAGYLMFEGPSRERLTASEAAYRSAGSSREVSRGVVRPTLLNRPYLMTYGAGFDNRDLLPPFMPVMRNEDGIFGLALRQGWERSLTGHLPWMLLHSPMESRSLASVDRPGVDSYDLVFACLASLDLGQVKPDGAPRLGALGRHLVDLASLGSQGFQDAIRRLLWLRAEGTVGTLTDLLDLHGEAPPYWAQDVRKSLERQRQAVSAEDFPTPRDLERGRSAAEARERGRRLVLRYGRLLEGWPDLVKAAGSARARGRALARPI